MTKLNYKFCTILIATLIFNSCGFLRNARITKEYLEKAGPDSVEACLVTWPFHAIMIPFMAVADQVVHSFEIIPEAGLDSWDYLLLKGNGNNLMLERTIAVPKTLATPIVYVLAYITRWFIPLGENTRPFKPDDNMKDSVEEPGDDQIIEDIEPETHSEI